MTISRSDQAVNDLGGWINDHFPTERLIAMIATDSSRSEAAREILKMHWYADATLQATLEPLVDPSEEDDRVRLSALRDALSILARGTALGRMDGVYA